jgi:hypothetical protein
VQGNRRARMLSRKKPHNPNPKAQARWFRQKRLAW